MVQFTNFFAGYNLHVLRKIIIRKNRLPYIQCQSDKTGKTNKPTRKTHIKKKQLTVLSIMAAI